MRVGTGGSHFFGSFFCKIGLISCNLWMLYQTYLVRIFLLSTSSSVTTGYLSLRMLGVKARGIKTYHVVAIDVVAQRVPD